MIYFAMALLLPLVWFGPWWSVALAALWTGWVSGPRFVNALQFASAAGVVSAALAFIKDGQNAGLIAPRMSRLFGMTYSPMIFLIVFGVTFVTAFLCFRAGGALSVLYRSRTISEKSVAPN